MKILQKLVSVTMTATMVIGIGGNLMAAKKNVKIDAAHFPDPEFRKLVSDQYDTNHDDILSLDEVEQVSSFKLKNSNITSLEGIEYLQYIKKLSIEECYMEELDLYDNFSLTDITLYRVHGLKKLTPGILTTNLNVNSCEDLTEIDLADTDYLSRLTLIEDRSLTGTLDASASIYLTYVYFKNTPISTLYHSKDKVCSFGCAFVGYRTELIEK